MSVLKVIFDLPNKQTVLDTSNFFGSSFAEVHFCVNSTDSRVDPNLKFGFSLFRGSDFIASKEHPQVAAKYEVADSMPLLIERYWMVADHNHKLNVYYEYQQEKLEFELDFVPGRPSQPYPSWTWVDGFWQPPVKKPINGPYEWNENTQEWIPQFPPNSVYAQMAQYGNEQVDPATGKVIRALNDENHKPSPFGSPGIEIALKRD